MEISQREEQDFSLDSDLYTNKTLALVHGLSLSSYHILIRKSFELLWSKLSEATTSRKRPPRLDILGGRLQEVRLYTEHRQSHG